MGIEKKTLQSLIMDMRGKPQKRESDDWIREAISIRREKERLEALNKKPKRVYRMKLNIEDDD